MKKLLVIVSCVTCITVVIASSYYFIYSNNNLEIDDLCNEENMEFLPLTWVKISDINKITATRFGSVQLNWETSDVENIEKIIEYLSTVEVTRDDSLGGSGSFITLSFVLNEAINDIYEFIVEIYSIDIHFVYYQGISNDLGGCIPVYKVSNGLSEDEWYDLLSLWICEPN
ncbi:MAG: hypothetical protein LBC71_05535 [Oscillospiraceae bacterium]|jgi:hypothetical protein|nr:hypothetical protein [Oscillospiraceae bacterium]